MRLIFRFREEASISASNTNEDPGMDLRKSHAHSEQVLSLFLKLALADFDYRLRKPVVIGALWQ